MSGKHFIMPSEAEITKLRKKHGKILLIELSQNGKEYKAIVRGVYTNTIRGIDTDSITLYRSVWDRVKLIYDEEFDTMDDIMIQALIILTDKNNTNT